MSFLKQKLLTISLILTIIALLPIWLMYLPYALFTGVFLLLCIPATLVFLFGELVAGKFGVGGIVLTVVSLTSIVIIFRCKKSILKNLNNGYPWSGWMIGAIFLAYIGVTGVLWWKGDSTLLYFYLMDQIYSGFCVLLGGFLFVITLWLCKPNFKKHVITCCLGVVLSLEILMILLGWAKIWSTTFKIGEWVSPYNPDVKIVHYTRQSDLLDATSLAGPCFLTLETRGSISLIYSSQMLDAKPCSSSVNHFNPDLKWLDARTISTNGETIVIPALKQ